MYFRHWESLDVRHYVKLVTDSTAEPVGTSDIKRQVNLPTTFYGDDDWLSGAVMSARYLVENELSQSLVNKTYDLVLNRFPGSDMAFELPFPPLSSVTSITYYDGTNSITTLASSNFQVHSPSGQYGWIAPRNNGSWPTTYSRPDAVTVRYVAGYGASATSVPANIRHAIKMLVGHWYENREAVNVGQAGQELPLGVAALLGSAKTGNYL